MPRDANRLGHDRITRRFYDLVWPHRADVLRVARFLCRDHSVADDLAQETLLKAFGAIGGLSGEGNVKAWLLAILRNAWMDRMRAGRRRESSLGDVDNASAVVAPAVTDRVEFGDDPQRLLQAFSDQQVIDALQALPEDIRWTLLLVDVEGLSVQEAADMLGVPAGTIKSRAHRGRAMLRQSLLPLARDRRLAVGGDAPATPDPRRTAERT